MVQRVSSRGPWYSYADGPPKGPWVLNEDSEQAQGLIAWFPNLPGGLLRNFAKSNLSTGVTGAPVWTPDIFGNWALRYDGVDDESTFTGATLDGETECTMSAWIRAETDSPTFQRVLSSEPGPFVVLGIQFSIGSGVHYSVATSGTGVNMQSDVGLPLNKDQLILGTVKIGIKGDVYLDGIVQSKGASDIIGTGTIADLSAETWAIGGRTTDTARQFTGLIRDMRIYNRFFRDAQQFQLFDPSTRYDLFHELGRVLYFFPPVAGGGFFSRTYYDQHLGGGSN